MNNLSYINYISTSRPTTSVEKSGIEGYKPQYNFLPLNRPETTPTEEVTTTTEATPVVEEETTTPIVENTGTGIIYDKADHSKFVSDMRQAYTEALKESGIDESFADYLVAQDALESRWGNSALAKHFNFGGIKAYDGAPSVEMDTQEYAKGATKSHTIKSKFRKFKDLKDYAKYKINLLNGHRYQAFSNGVNDFYNRVVKGGYATSPKYLESLQNVYKQLTRYAKYGGILERTNTLYNILSNYGK